MKDRPAMQMLYVPLPANLWGQAVFLTMRPEAVRKQASAMLVEVAQVVGELAWGAGGEGPESFALPAGQQARAVDLVRAVLVRCASPANGR